MLASKISDQPSIAAGRSISVRVMVSAFLLAMLGLFFAGVMFVQSWQYRDQLLLADRTGDVRSILSEAVLELSLERSLSQVGLALPDPVSPGLRRLLDAQRQKSDAGFARLTTLLDAGSIGGQVDAFRRNMADLRQQFATLRRSIDAQLSLPAAQRQPEQVDALPRTMKDLVVQAHAERHLMRGAYLDLPTPIVMLETARDLAWQVREFGGQERTYLMIAASTGTPIAPNRLAEMEGLARRVGEAAQELRRLTSYPVLPDSIRVAVRRIDEEYFGSYDRIRSAMLAEAAKPAPAYALDGSSFMARSSAALDTAEALSATAHVEIGAVFKQLQATALRSLMAAGVVMLVILAVAVLASLMIVRAFQRLAALRSAMGQLAVGDTSVTIPELAARDEVGAMARALEVFRTGAQEKVALEIADEAGRAMRERRAAELDRHTREFGATLGGVMGRLSAAAGRMSGTAADMERRAAQTTRVAETTALAATGAVNDLGAVAAATEQLTASVGEIARQAASSARAAQILAQRATQADATMTRLNDTASSIGEVARMIGNIAGQTNLLALNATIEAARAGEAGKGFAVVANEVKALAGQTAKATEQIAGQIQAIQLAATEAVEVVRGMAGQVNSMGETASAIAAAVEQQGAATREISGSVATVLATSQQTVVAMGQATDSAREAGRSSGDVRSAAAAVSQETKELGREVEQFLHVISEVKSERRSFERIAGDNRPVTVTLAGGAPLLGRLVDLSLGGAGVRLDGPMPAGEVVGCPVMFGVAGLPALDGRIARVADGLLGIVLKQDEASNFAVSGLLKTLSSREAA